MSDIPTTLAIFIAGVLIVYVAVGFAVYGALRIVAYAQDKERYHRTGKRISFSAMVMLSLSFPMAVLIYVMTVANDFVMWKILNKVSIYLRKFDRVMGEYTDKIFGDYEMEKTDD